MNRAFGLWLAVCTAFVLVGVVSYFITTDPVRLAIIVTSFLLALAAGIRAVQAVRNGA
jgi:hypothetical protein